ncbi:hypothetical protein Vafri_17534, partial [Volvox africanus]
EAKEEEEENGLKRLRSGPAAGEATYVPAKRQKTVQGDGKNENPDMEKLERENLGAEPANNLAGERPAVAPAVRPDGGGTSAVTSEGRKIDGMKVDTEAIVVEEEASEEDSAEGPGVEAGEEDAATHGSGRGEDGAAADAATREMMEPPPRQSPEQEPRLKHAPQLQRSTEQSQQLLQRKPQASPKSLRPRPQPSQVPNNPKPQYPKRKR